MTRSTSPLTVQNALFKGRDAVVVIDDWKAGVATAVDSPTYFAGRIFMADDPKVGDLCGLLAEAGADRWHASGDRATTEFLFSSPFFDEIVMLVGGMKSILVDMLNGARAFESAHVMAQWQVLQRESVVARSWPTANPQAIAFFRYAEFLCGYLEQLLPGVSVRLLVDAMDWLNAKVGETLPSEPGLRALGWGQRGVTAELVMLEDKRGVGATPYLPLLGLVDSEAWAFGRLQSLKFADGRTVRQRLIEWRDNGKLPHQGIFSEQEFGMLVSPHASHAQLLTYWQLWAEWGSTGRIACLAEADSSSMERARAASILTN